MNRTAWLVSILFFLAAPTVAQELPVLDFSDAVESALPAVVTVAAMEADGPEQFFGFADADARRAAVDAAYRTLPDISAYAGSGSGFVIRRDGDLYVVTNAHVIQGAGTEADIAVFSVEQREYRMRLVGGDSYRDVAVLAFVDRPGPELATIEIHTGDDLRIGSPVFAIGNPLGRFPYSVSSGVIGGLNRSLHGFTGRDGYIQSDAAIIWGNSGGPLIDGRGRVVGLNTRIHLVNREPYAFAVPQLNFALEGRYMARIVDDIIETGRFQRAYLGGLFEEHQRRRGGPAEVVLASVVEGSPASRSLSAHVGQTLVSIDGQPVTDAADVNGLFERVHPDSRVRLEFRDGGQTRPVTVATGRLGDEEAAQLGHHIARTYLNLTLTESSRRGVIGGLRVLSAPATRTADISLHNVEVPPREGDEVALAGYYIASGSTAWRTATMREFAMVSRVVMPSGWLGIWFIGDDGVGIYDASIPRTGAI